MDSRPAIPTADRILGIAHAPLAGLRIEQAFAGLVGTPMPERYRAIASGAAPWDSEQLAYQDGRMAGFFEVHAFQASPGRASCGPPRLPARAPRGPAAASPAGS